MSAEAAGISRTTAYNRKWSDSEFEAEWKVAEALGVEALEDEALRRAIKGVSEPVYQGGELVGHKQRYSDTLAIFLLKAKKPNKYRDRVHLQHEGKTDELDGLTPDEFRQVGPKLLKDIAGWMEKGIVK